MWVGTCVTLQITPQGLAAGECGSLLPALMLTEDLPHKDRQLSTHGLPAFHTCWAPAAGGCHQRTARPTASPVCPFLDPLRPLRSKSPPSTHFSAHTTLPFTPWPSDHSFTFPGFWRAGSRHVACRGVRCTNERASHSLPRRACLDPFGPICVSELHQHGPPSAFRFYRTLNIRKASSLEGGIISKSKQRLLFWKRLL